MGATGSLGVGFFASNNWTGISVVINGAASTYIGGTGQTWLTHMQTNMAFGLSNASISAAVRLRSAVAGNTHYAGGYLDLIAIPR